MGIWQNRQAARSGLALICAFVGTALPVLALDELTIQTPGAPDDLRDAITGASLLLQARRDRATSAQNLFAVARADYGRILGVLYENGYYSGTIRIIIDGQEAASIPPLDSPDQISRIAVIATPGPLFRFAKTDIAPLSTETDLPEEFATGQPAQSGVIVDAARAGVQGWRQQGHAKARIAGQSVVADHRANQLDADVQLDPGPRVRFGEMSMSGYERMNPRRLAKIAGFPTGEVFDPDELDKVANRLRRTGVFQSVALREADELGPGNTLDVALIVDEEELRRLGFGAEIASLDGATLSAFWLHRNLLGGAERFRIDGEVSGIGGQTGGVDYSLGLRIDRPATLGPDTSAYIQFRAEKAEEEDYTAENLEFGIGFTRIINDELTAEIGLGYLDSQIEDDTGTSDYRLLTLPISAVWDTRDSALDASEGIYVNASLTPFLGYEDAGSGGRITGDGRAYRAFGDDGRFVLAGRLQLGTVTGVQLDEVPRDYLFYSGGGGTVRGQPYQSLGVSVLGGGTVRSGGLSFAALSAELRADISDQISIVAFYDQGFVSEGEFFSDGNASHSGAGLGLRYNTGIGPIRLDIAAPVSGDTGDGVQIYVGIGQAF